AQVGWPRLCFKQPPNSSGNNNRRAPRTEHDQDRNVARSKRWRKMGTLDLDDTNATHSPSGNRGLASWLRGSILPESIDGTGSFTKGAPRRDSPQAMGERNKLRQPNPPWFLP